MDWSGQNRNILLKIRHDDLLRFQFFCRVQSFFKALVEFGRAELNGVLSVSEFLCYDVLLFVLY